MIIIRKFQPADVLAIELQPTQQVEPGSLDLEYGEKAATGEAWTGVDSVTGRIMGCGGIVPIFQTQGVAWALFASGIGSAMTVITRQARDAIAASPFIRIEALVRADWPQASHWALCVGLTRNALLRRWGPMAQDHYLFERIKS